MSRIFEKEGEPGHRWRYPFACVRYSDRLIRTPSMPRMFNSLSGFRFRMAMQPLLVGGFHTEADGLRQNGTVRHACESDHCWIWRAIKNAATAEASELAPSKATSPFDVLP